MVTARLKRPDAALAAWTVLVWITRVRNVWEDTELSLWGRGGRLALALSFLGLAGAVVFGLVRTQPSPWAKTLALWTLGVWLVRGAQIVTGEHSTAFVVVHVLLGVVSAALAGRVLLSRTIRTTEPAQV